jgi:CRISPR-associated protein Cas2
MVLLVSYDVSCNRRRRRLHKALGGWLEPVQQSVFEGHLIRGALVPLERAVVRAIDPDVDSVRLYPLCRACAGATRLHGIATPTPDPDAPLFL